MSNFLLGRSRQFSGIWATTDGASQRRLLASQTQGSLQHGVPITTSALHSPISQSRYGYDT